jgi:photosystem II stability/assembly factor-like uncharacterized protein
MFKYALLLYASLITTIINAQWVTQYSDNSYWLNSVYFSDANNGYAVGYNTVGGSNGAFFKTTDGGANWSVKYTSLTPGTNFQAVCFTDANTGFIVGNVNYNFVTMRTIDGGTTWTSQPGGGSAICFTDANTGYIANGSIAKTTDGGITWMNQNTPAIYPLLSVHFSDANNGFALGNNGNVVGTSSIVKTTNGGSDWAEVGFANDGVLNSLFFIDANTGFVVGDAGKILKTINGGNSWTVQSSGTTECLSSVYFTDLTTGYVAGCGGTILKTTDGGTTWFHQTSNTSDYLSSVYFASANTGYVAGGNVVYPDCFGIILKTTNGGGLGINENSVASNILEFYPNPAHDKITIESSFITGKTYLVISNSLSQEIIKQKIINNKTQIDVSFLPSGIYLVKVKNDKMVETGKLIKE